MTEKDLLLGVNGAAKLEQVKYCFVQDEDDLPAMPGFLAFAKQSRFCFRFDSCETAEQALKGYDGERNFVVYCETVPLNEAVFKELADKNNQFGFEKLVLVSEFRPETMISAELRGLFDYVDRISRHGNIFSVVSMTGKCYFDRVKDEV